MSLGDEPTESLRQVALGKQVSVAGSSFSPILDECGGLKNSALTTAHNRKRYRTIISSQQTLLVQVGLGSHFAGDRKSMPWSTHEETAAP